MKISSFLFLFLFLTITITPQQKKFLVGAFAESFEPNLSHPYTDLLNAGIHSPFNYVQLQYIHNPVWLGDSVLYTNMGWPMSITPNFAYFSNFDSVISSNSISSYRCIKELNPTAPSPNYHRNFDWIYFLSSAYHYTFDATENFREIDNNSIALWHKDGYQYIDSYGKKYWKIECDGDPDTMVNGPAVYQETRYRGSFNPQYNWRDYDNVSYTVSFGLKVESSGSEDPVVCTLAVKCRYKPLGEDSEYIRDSTIVSRTLTVSEVAVEQNLSLTYNLNGFDARIGRQRGGPLLLDISYPVFTTRERNLLIDTIEVHDNKIWSTYFLINQELKLSSMLQQYILSFQNESSPFMSKWKFASTIDEPHSIYSYDAIGIIDDALTNLRSTIPTTPRLFTHFYPNWDGTDFRWGYNIIKHFIEKAHPDPYHFYYIFNHEDHNNVSVDRVRWLSWNANVYSPSKSFFFTIDTWAEPDNPNCHWRWPHRWELQASVMLAMAYGCKGIFYEPFYSYGGVQGLAIPDGNGGYCLNQTLGEFVRDSINTRLNGKLGSSVIDYQSNGHCLLASDSWATQELADRFSTETRETSYDYLTLLSINPAYKQLVGMFDHKTDNRKKAIFLASYDSIPETFVLHFSRPEGVSNSSLSIVDVENGFDTSYVDTVTHSFYIGRAGDGRFILIAPSVLIGGILAVDDTISSPDTLNGELTIPQGRMLALGSIYTLATSSKIIVHGTLRIAPNKNAHITGQGKIIIEPDGQLLLDGEDTLTIENTGGITIRGPVNVDDGAHLIINENSSITTGDSLDSNSSFVFGENSGLIVYGTANIRRTAFDWNDPNTNRYQLIFHGDEGGIDSVQIKHAYYGVFLHGASIPICNTVIDSCGKGIFAINSHSCIYQNTISYCNTGFFNQNIDLPPNTSGTVQFYDNNIHHCTFGIYTYDTDLYSTFDTITNCSHGIYLTGGNPIFGCSAPPGGYNEISNNTVGIYCEWTNVLLGLKIDRDEFAGYNSIYDNNSLNIGVYDGSYVDAMINYWASGENSPSGLECESASYLSYDPWLTAPPVFTIPE